MNNENNLYGNHDYAIKPLNNKDDVFEDNNKKEIEKIKKKKPKSIDKILREKALKVISKHGDKLYPLEILGAYVLTYESPSKSYDLLGDPEKFIDDKLINFLNNSNIQESSIYLRNLLNSDILLQDAFKLRLNYALLLEESIDTVSIHKNNEKDISSNYKTYEDNMDDDDKYKTSNDLSDSFYNNSDVISEKKVGTSFSIRQKILNVMQNSNFDIDYNLDDVYKKLNDFNKNHVEYGILSRILYLIFTSDNPLKLERLNNGY